jgi:endonuclease/exonuclease/phosphatase family metal-dependent hydrolase
MWVEKGKTGVVLCDEVVHKETGEIYYFFNNHFHMDTTGRLNSSIVVKDILKRFIGTEKIAHAKILWMGDFNAFPTVCGKKQVDNMLKSGQLIDATEKATYLDGEKALYSFKAFPYDVIPKSAYDKETGMLVPGKLDHILTKNIKSCNPKVDSRTVAQVLLSNNEKLNAINPSDHFLTKITVVTTDDEDELLKKKFEKLTIDG